jgi:putative endonuclease
MTEDDEEAKRLGRAGEDAAAGYLLALGFTILRRNLRGPGGEIDIVARDRGVIVFIEVKTRRTRAFGPAISAVDGRKRRRIRAVAEDFLQFFAPNSKARFDVLTIDRGTMRLHRGAFLA